MIFSSFIFLITLLDFQWLVYSIDPDCYGQDCYSFGSVTNRNNENWCYNIPTAVIYVDGPDIFDEDGSYLERYRYLAYLNVFSGGDDGNYCMTEADKSYTGYVGIKLRGRSTRTVSKSQFSVKTYGMPSVEQVSNATAAWHYTMNAGGDTPVSGSCVTFNPALGTDVDCGSYSSRSSCLGVTRTVPGHPLTDHWPLPCEWLPDHSPGHAQDMPPKIETELMGFPSHADWIFHAPGTYDHTLLRNHLAYKMARDSNQFAPRSQFFHLFLVAEYGREGPSREPTMADYRGVYLLTEGPRTRGKDRVDIGKMRADDGFMVDRGAEGGYIIAYNSVNEYELTIDCRLGSKCNAGYPDNDDITLPQLEYIQNAQRAFDTTALFMDEDIIDPTINDPLNPEQIARFKYRDFIDIDSWLLYFLHMEISRDPDGYANSLYFYKHENTGVYPCTNYQPYGGSSSLIINEVVYSKVPVDLDWVEFYNRGHTSFDIVGYYFTDSKSKNRFDFPSIVLSPGEYYRVTREEFGFGLGSSDEVNLYDHNDNLVDSVVWYPYMNTDGKSLVRCPNGDGPFSIGPEPTPGGPNFCPSDIEQQQEPCEDFPASDYYAPPLPKGATYGKFGCGPVWDYNLAYGRNSRGPTEWLFERNNPRFWRQLTTRDPYVTDRLVTLWTKARRTYWSLDYLNLFLDTTMDVLIEGGLEEELNRDNEMNEWADEVGIVRDYLAARMEWMDNNICSLYNTYPLPSHPFRQDSQCSSCINGDCVCGLCVCDDLHMGDGCQYSIDTPPATPAPPVLVDSTSHSLQISWTLPDAFGAIVRECEMSYYSPSDPEVRVVSSPGSVTTVTIDYLYPNTQYHVTLLCSSDGGVSPVSDEVVFMTEVHVTPSLADTTLSCLNRPTEVHISGSELGDVLQTLDVNCHSQEFVFDSSSVTLNLSPGIYQLCYRLGDVYPHHEPHSFTKMIGQTIRSFDEESGDYLSFDLSIGPDDDIEERDVGPPAFGSSDLEIGNDGANHQTIGIRILANPIVTDDLIIWDSVQLAFVAKSSDDSPITAVIHGLYDASPFVASQEDAVSRRETTTASVEWTIPAWTAGTTYRSPDISAIVAELVAYDGYVASQLAFSITTTCLSCRRTAWSGDRADGPRIYFSFNVLTDVSFPDSSPDRDCPCAGVAPTSPTLAPTRAPTLPPTPPPPTLAPTTPPPTPVSVEYNVRNNFTSCSATRLSRTEYSSIAEASSACDANPECGGFYDRSCNGPPYQLCPQQAEWRVSSSSCVFSQASALLSRRSRKRKFSYPLDSKSLSPIIG